MWWPMPQQEGARQAGGQTAGAEEAADWERGLALSSQPLTSFEMMFTYRSWLYCKIALPSQLAALCLNTNIKNDTGPEMFKTQARCKQLAASSYEEPQPKVAPWEDKEKPASTGYLEAPLQPDAHSASCRQPRTPPAQQSIPQDPNPFQSHSFRHEDITAYVPSRQDEHCHVDVTIGKHDYITLNWEGKKKKNHLHAQTEAKNNFANISRKSIVLCFPNISRRYYGKAISPLKCDNSIKIYHND